MKSGITLLSCIILMSACVATAAEKTVTQAELDAKQFASEQAAKEQSAQANTTNRALQLDAHYEKHGKFIHDWLITSGRDKDNKPIKRLAKLPNDALSLINEFHCGDPQKLKFIANNMEKLLPAVLRWDGLIFKKIRDTKNDLTTTNLQSALMSIMEEFASTQQILKPQDNPEFANNPDSFFAYRFNKAIIFKVCPKKFKLLQSLSMQQLAYLVFLGDLHAVTVEHNPNNTTQWHTIATEIQSDDQAAYYELPEEIRTCIDSTYGENMPETMYVTLEPSAQAQQNQQVPDLMPDQFHELNDEEAAFLAEMD